MQGWVSVQTDGSWSNDGPTGPQAPRRQHQKRRRVPLSAPPECRGGSVGPRQRPSRRVHLPDPLLWALLAILHTRGVAASWWDHGTSWPPHLLSRIDHILSRCQSCGGHHRGGVPYSSGWAVALVLRFVAPVQARPAASHSRARGGESPPQPLSGQEAWQVPSGEGPTAKFWQGDISRLEDGEVGGGPLGRGDSTRTFAPLLCPHSPTWVGAVYPSTMPPAFARATRRVGGVGGAPPPLACQPAGGPSTGDRPSRTQVDCPHAAWLGAAPLELCHHPVTTHPSPVVSLFPPTHAHLSAAVPVAIRACHRPLLWTLSLMLAWAVLSAPGPGCSP